jgi:hypothetical protein
MKAENDSRYREMAASTTYTYNDCNYQGNYQERDCRH